MGHSTRKIQHRYICQASQSCCLPVWEAGATVPELQMCMCAYLRYKFFSVSADAPGTIMSQKFAMTTGLMDKYSRPRVNALQQFMLHGSPLVFMQIKWRLYDTAVTTGAGIYVPSMCNLVHNIYSVLFAISAKMMFEGVFGTRSGGTAEITGLYTQWVR